MNDTNEVNIYICDGVEGMCLVINGVRVAGPKPWGGGKIIKEWDIDKDKIMEALNEE